MRISLQSKEVFICIASLVVGTQGCSDGAGGGPRPASLGSGQGALSGCAAAPGTVIELRADQIFDTLGTIPQQITALQTGAEQSIYFGVKASSVPGAAVLGFARSCGDRVLARKYFPLIDSSEADAAEAMVTDIAVSDQRVYVAWEATGPQYQDLLHKGRLSSYALTASGDIIPGTLTVAPLGGEGAAALALHPKAPYLYATDEVTSTLYRFTLDTGGAPDAGTHHSPPERAPEGRPNDPPMAHPLTTLAVDQEGQYLYVGGTDDALEIVSLGDRDDADPAVRAAPKQWTRASAHGAAPPTCPVPSTCELDPGCSLRCPAGPDQSPAYSFFYTGNRLWRRWTLPRWTVFRGRMPLEYLPIDPGGDISLPPTRVTETEDGAQHDVEGYAVDLDPGPWAGLARGVLWSAEARRVRMADGQTISVGTDVVARDPETGTRLTAGTGFAPKHLGNRVATHLRVTRDPGVAVVATESPVPATLGDVAERLYVRATILDRGGDPIGIFPEPGHGLTVLDPRRTDRALELLDPRGKPMSETDVASEWLPLDLWLQAPADALSLQIAYGTPSEAAVQANLIHQRPTGTPPYWRVRVELGYALQAGDAPTTFHAFEETTSAEEIVFFAPHYEASRYRREDAKGLVDRVDEMTQAAADTSLLVAPHRRPVRFPVGARNEYVGGSAHLFDTSLSLFAHLGVNSVRLFRTFHQPLASLPPMAAANGMTHTFFQYDVAPIHSTYSDSWTDLESAPDPFIPFTPTGPDKRDYRADMRITRGYFDYATPGAPDRYKVNVDDAFGPTNPNSTWVKQGELPDKLAWHMLGDEEQWHIKPKSPTNAPDIQAYLLYDVRKNYGKHFRAWLRGQSIPRNDLGWAVGDIADLGTALPIAPVDASAPDAEKKKWYWTVRYFQESAARHLFNVRDAITKRAFDDPSCSGGRTCDFMVAMNYNNGVDARANQWVVPDAGGATTGVSAAPDWFRAQRMQTDSGVMARSSGEPGGFVPWSQVRLSDGTASVAAFRAETLRSAVQLPHKLLGAPGSSRTRFGMYVGPGGLHGGSDAATYIGLSHVARGARAIELWSFGPAWVAPDDGWSDRLDLYPDFAHLSETIARAENLLYDGEPMTGRIAIQAESVASLWGSTTDANALEPMFLQQALTHAGYAVDMVDDESMARGALDHYAVLYLTQRHTAVTAQKAAYDWIRSSAGRRLVAVPAAATRDQFDRPTTLLDGVLGATSRERGATDLPTDLFKGRLDSYEPAGTLTGVRAGRTVWRLPGHPLASIVGTGTLLARIGNAPALTEQRIPGAGAAVLYSFYPGLQYWLTRVARDADSLPSWDDGMRRWATLPAETTEAELGAPLSPVSVSVPGVEVVAMESAKGFALVAFKWDASASTGAVTIQLRTPRTLRMGRRGDNDPVTLTRTSSGYDVTVPLDSVDVIRLCETTADPACR